MCVTHVYRCPLCYEYRAVPRHRSSVTRHLCEWIRTGPLVVGVDVKQPVVDKMCDNRYCMRRNEGGYQVCLFMEDPCFFCIRYGWQGRCFNQVLPLVCRSCHLSKHGTAAPYLNHSPHFRAQRPLDKDEDPRSEAVREARKDCLEHAAGRLELSPSLAMASAAVAAATHQ
jgi:hypothetical protein